MSNTTTTDRRPRRLRGDDGAALVEMALVIPILGAIITMAASEADLQRGLLLLGAYSAGLAVPFLLAALMVDRFLKAFAKLRHQMVWVNRIAGAMLLVVGVLMITGRFTMLSTWLQDLTPDFILDRI